MKYLVVSALLVLGFVNNGLCLRNVTCKAGPSEEFVPRKNLCYAFGFPTHSNLNEEIYDILLDYADPNDITEVEISNHSSPAIEFIPRQILTAFPNIHTFIMSENLKELVPGDFDHAVNLIRLHLTRHEIEVIRANVFSNGTAQNQPSTVDTVQPLGKLTELYLQQNLISEIEDNSFFGLNNLERIDLSHNQLKVIRRLTFAGLPALLRLRLNSNGIENIEDGAFNLPELDLLDLYENNLKRLSDDTFQHTPQLRYIRLENNELEHIGQSLYRATNAQRISLDNNRVQDIDLAAFAKMPKLKYLFLGENGLSLTTIINDGDNSNSPLTSLNIEGNNLTDATELSKLRIFPRIKSLNLSGNLFSDMRVEGSASLTNVLPSLSSLFIRDLVNVNCTSLTLIARKLQSRGVDVTHDCE